MAKKLKRIDAPELTVPTENLLVLK